VTNETKALEGGSDKYATSGSTFVKWTNNNEYDIKIPEGVKITSIKIMGYANDNSTKSYLADIVVGSDTPNKGTTTYSSNTFPTRDETNKVTATYTYALPVVADGNDLTNNVIKFMFAKKQTSAIIYLIAPKSFELDATNYKTQSLYLGFNATIPDGVTAYTGTLNGEKTTLNMTPIEGTVLPANTGVIVEAGNNAKYVFAETTESVTVSNDNDLQGVTEKTEVSALENGQTLLTFGIKDNVLAFRKPANTYIAANKAYLLVGSAQANKAIGLSFDGNTSTINAISATPTTTDAPAYNIMGQRVGANAKGLIIKGGRKYIVK